MNHEKIGKFIQNCRKEQGITQAQMAEKLNITDRAVSKWETGRSLPDASIMLELCELLNINVNELLTGEKIAMENYNKYAEENMISLKEENERHVKLLYAAEVIIGCISLTAFMLTVGIGACGLLYQSINTLSATILIIFGFAMLLAGTLTAMYIEQRAGYYVCPECGHVHVPTYREIFLAPHIGRVRRLKCQSCGKICFQKKILTKEQ